ncbi:uncharacterized protein RSE6_11016 [Rhynchosporium secalis]|uniref:Uncharacterized protein n=1 Tax=Rhynchosporium secalis TaxID=38038 RepID=A0A1E1MLY1_RHYSE|nr:uncharacterized protein RSE6_11016 [Rhynchosporium secalis]
MDVQIVGDLEPLVILGSSPCFLLKVACRFRGSQIIVLEMNKHSPLPHHSTNPSNKPPFYYSPSRRPVSHPRPRSPPILPAYTENEPTVVIRRLLSRQKISTSPSPSLIPILIPSFPPNPKTNPKLAQVQTPEPQNTDPIPCHRIISRDETETEIALST